MSLVLLAIGESKISTLIIENRYSLFANLKLEI
jgi:hypothetical protein